MMRTIEAIVEQDGTVRLLEPIEVSTATRALVTLLPTWSPVDEATLLSEAALSDWNRPEEDAAWSYLQSSRASTQRSSR